MDAPAEVEEDNEEEDVEIWSASLSRSSAVTAKVLRTHT
jgi:hypothetical protein